MLVSTGLLLSLLTAEQHRGDLSPFLALADGSVRRVDRSLPDLPDAERPLVAAAAALAAGEPKRALRAIENAGGSRETEEVVGALQLAARTLDLNWYPGGGGAVISDEDIARMAREVPRPDDPGTKLVVLIAARLIPRVQSARRIADDSRTGDWLGAVGSAVEMLRELGGELEALGAAGVLAYFWLAVADAMRRAGRTADAADALKACTHFAADDPVALAHLNLTRGDWAIEPYSHPEVLGLQLGAPVPANMTMPSDPPKAQLFYDQADALYAQAGALRGRAAIAMRRAHLARRAGDRGTCAALRDEARRLAARSGENALARLLDVHRVLDRLDAGEDVAPGEAHEVAGWSETDGSTSFTRGVVRLILARSSAWQETGATLAALRGLRLARHLAARLEATAEVELADRAYVALVDRLNFRRASAVLLAADTARAIARLRASPADPLDWLRAAELAISLDRATEAIADPDLKAVAATRLAEVDAAAVSLASQPDTIDVARAWVRESARRAETLVLRYQGRRAEDAGFRDEAVSLRQQALARAEEQGDQIMRVVLLGELDRQDEARRLAADMLRGGQLHPDHAVELFLRLGDPSSAQQALQMLDKTGWTPAPDRAWEETARRAEVAEALGDHLSAARLAGIAVDEFERRASQLVRDALRTSATDDIPVAGMYHTAVLAHLSLAVLQIEDERDGEVATAFEMSDRCRGIAVDVLRSLDDLPVGPARDAARRWLRAGSAWAAAYEGLVDEVTCDPLATPTSAELRRRVLATEEELDRTESRVSRLSPGLLAGRTGARPGADLAAVQQGLGGDAALVMYETFDEDLVLWAVEPDAIHHSRVRVRARDLACDVRRFHRACATGGRDDATAAALARLLLEPVSEVIQRRRRLFVVPHRALALVPFHALPLGEQLLGEHLTVSVLPSAALLARPTAGRSPRLQVPALLVGDPAYAADRRLPPLPGTATEVITIARILGTPDPLLGAAATETAVTYRAHDRPIIHLATHGVMYERAPNRSFLALAGHDELTVADIMGLDLGADLVVLSACHTGRGTATAGGDIVGLMRAAVTAGARHIIVSLWPVDDEAGCLLMTGVYEELAGGCGVADALARAQRRVRALDADGRHQAYERLRTLAGTASAAPTARDARPPEPISAGGDAQPYYWAPFIHVGV
jgi:CHAT domain-containing protein